MKRVLCVALAVMAAAALYAAAVPDGKRWWSYVEALANDDMKGRNTGSPEHRKAAEYVAAEFARLNIKPAGEQGFIQPVKFKSRKLVESGCSLELIRSGKAERLTLGEDAIIGIRVDPVIESASRPGSEPCSTDRSTDRTFTRTTPLA